ncbi:hypothetical protein U0070_012349 [Myodes glareolus]|uniref:Uncharacterized protein n=1 Tax=Myodes glareolus TaxID=447135 RepID=A0AAW0IZJ8_MYOGA
MLKRVLAKVLNVGLNPLSGDDLASGNHIVSVEERKLALLPCNVRVTKALTTMIYFRKGGQSKVISMS